MCIRDRNPTLRSLQSGLVASSELVQDFKTALQGGQTQSEAILQERVFDKTKTLTETIHRNKRRNFASEQVRVSSDISMTVAHMEKSGLVALLDLADESGIIKLEAALEGRVTEECLSMYNVDGSMRKTCKSNLLHLFNRNPFPEQPQDYISLVDMGLV